MPDKAERAELEAAIKEFKEEIEKLNIEESMSLACLLVCLVACLLNCLFPWLLVCLIACCLFACFLVVVAAGRCQC